MTSNHVPLISVFRMTFRMTLKMTFRMTLRMTLRVTLRRGLQKGLGRGVAVELSSAGLVQVWFSLEVRFNSLELDSEVGRLVRLTNQYLPSIFSSFITEV